MRAARYHGVGDVRVQTVAAPPEPGPGELLLSVAMAGICGSDAHEYKAGPALIHPLGERHPVTGHDGPLTLGHELAGAVVSVGAGVTGFEPGMLVSCGAGVSCGSCRRCVEGRTNLCERYATVGFHRDGGLAELCLVPADTCVEVASQGLSAHTAALAQPMAIAVHAARRGRVSAFENALVIGAGGIGCFLTYAIAAAGGRVAVLDVDPGRLLVARSLGAELLLDGSAEVPLVEALTHARLVPQVAFEVSGTAAGLRQALAAVPRGGRVVAVGIQSADASVDMRRVTLDEIELIGTVAHVCRDDLPEAVRLLAARAQGWHDVAPLVLSLERLVEDGLEPLARGRSPYIKTLVDPHASESRWVDERS